MHVIDLIQRTKLLKYTTHLKKMGRTYLNQTCIDSSDTRSLMNQLALGHFRFHWSMEGMGKNRDEDEGEGSEINTNWSWEEFYQIKSIHSFWEIKYTFHQSLKSNDFNPIKVKSILTKAQTQ